MRKPATTGNNIFVIVLILAISCNSNKSVPFPADNTEGKTPASKPLQLSPEQPLQWYTVNPDSIAPPKTTSFNTNSLPVKPFRVNDFKPEKSIIPRKLDWDNIPDSAINLDTLPAMPFKLQESPLPNPDIIKAGMPKILPNTSSGILQFSEEEGLPGLTVFNSLVDKQGTLWIVTDKGLSAYAGDYLYTWSFFINKAISGFPNQVFDMMEDSLDRIWLVTGGGGIYIVDNKKGILYHYTSPATMVSIFCDHSGNTWISGYQDRIFIINKEITTIKEIKWPDDKKADNWCIPIFEDRLHNIWLGNEDHISIIDADRKKIKKIGSKEGLVITVGIKFYEDSNDDIWIGAVAGETNIISLKNKTITSLNASNGFNNSGINFWEDKRNRLWIIHNDSITILNKEKTIRKTIITNTRAFRQGEAGMAEDKLGNFWIGTRDKGMMIINPYGPLPEHLDNKSGLADNNVWGLLEDKAGKIWIATFKGINIYDPAKNEIRLLAKEQGLGVNEMKGLRFLDANNILATYLTGFSVIDLQNNSTTTYGKEQGVVADAVWGGTKDEAGNIWASSSSGIFLFNAAQKKSLKKLDNSRGLLSNQVWDIVKDHKGNFWAPTDSGVMIINPVNGTLRYLREKEGLCNNNTMKIVVSANGEIWIATLKGISIVDADYNTITNITEQEGLLPDELYDLVERDDKMYAGSVNGMIAINRPPNGDTLSKWSFINYGKSAGFPYNDYNQMTGMARKNGEIWWGITPMLTIITQVPVADTLAPQVYITGIKVMDRELDSLSRSSYDSLTPLFKLPTGLTLPYNQNSFSFSYSNNEVIGRDKIVYRYILEGVDKDWSATTTKVSTNNYYNLSTGDYIFKVSSRNAGGTWSNPAELSFTIRPPWWQTWWAYLLYAIVFSGAVWLIGLYRSRWLKKENRILEEKVSHRTSQLKNTIEELKATQDQLIQSEKMASLGELTAGIAHEIQNPLNFVNNFSEVNSELLAEMKQEIDKGNFEEVKSIAKDITENEQKIIFHGKRADAIVKGMLQHSRSSSGQKEQTDINALCDEYLRLAYHGLRAKDKTFNAKMNTDFDTTLSKVNIVPQDIGRVILNLITNAFYSVTQKKKSLTGSAAQDYDPTVSVSTKRISSLPGNESKVEIRVKDNGNGIPQKVLDKIFQPFFTTKPTGEGTGLGLSMSYDIITKAHGGELNVKTKEGEFAEFIITLPQ